MHKKSTSASNITLFPLSRKPSDHSDPRIRELEAVIESQNREIWKLKQINAYLQQSLHKRENLIEKERTYYQKLKGMLNKSESLLPSVMGKDENKRFMELSPSRKTEDSIKYIQRSQSKQMTIFQNQLINSLQHSSETKDQQDAQANHSLQQFSIGEESLKLYTILDMNISDEDACHQYENDASIKFMQALISDEDKFMKIITQSGYQKLSFIYDKIKKITVEHRTIFKLLLRFKTLIKAAFQITQSLVLDEALEKIIQQTIQSLDCDRSSCFVADVSKGELWSKAAQGVNTVIRFPMSKGVAGYVATHREVVNILNAYSDNRFNKDFDVKTNYKTKTILAAPIVDNDQLLGVLQCINKQDGFFSKEDEALLKIICDFSKIVLKHTMNNDQQVMTLNKLRQSVRCGIHFQEASQKMDLRDFMLQAQKNLKALMSTDQVRIVVRKNDQTLFYDDSGELNTLNTKTGIMNTAMNVDTQISIFSPQQHHDYCPLIDLKTSLPIICQPIRYEGTVIASLMVSNVKGISTINSNPQPRISPIDAEVLKYFNEQIAISLIKFLQ